MNNQLIEALQAAYEGTAGEHEGLTMRQLVKKTGKSQESLRSDLRRLLEAGQLDVTRVRLLRIDGAYSTVPAYKLKPAAGDGDGDG